MLVHQVSRRYNPRYNPLGLKKWSAHFEACEHDYILKLYILKLLVQQASVVDHFYERKQESQIDLRKSFARCRPQGTARQAGHTS